MCAWMVRGTWPALSGTRYLMRAMDRLAAVSEPEQRGLTERAERSVIEGRIRRREATAAEVRRELEHHESRVRYLVRELKRLQRPI